MLFRGAIIALFCAGLARVSAVETGGNWYHRDWQTEDGLPAANVTGIVQTRDGYLWLTTQSGLARFDGVQFEEVPIPTKGARLLTRLLFCDHAENLWLAQDRGVVVRIAPDRSRMFSAADSLPDSLPLQMAEAADHALLICYANRSVFRIDTQDRVERMTAAQGLPDDGLCSLTTDAGGALWWAKGATYGVVKGDQFFPRGSVTERNPQIAGARDGSVWFCGATELLKMPPNGAPVVVARFDTDMMRARPSVLFVDARGRVWVGTSADGLFLFDNANFLRIDTSQNNIRAITEDREGNIWVGTEGGGLDRLSEKEVELYGRDEEAPFETVRSLAEDRTGDLWLVAQDGSLMKLPHGDWPAGQKVDWAGGQAHCVIVDKEGVVWIGTSQHGLFRWQNGAFDNVSTADGLGGLNVRSLLVDKENGLWIGLESEHLAQRFYQGRFQSFRLPADAGAVRAMAEDASGRVWMGTLDGQLFRTDGAKVSAVAQPPSVAAHPIRCLNALADGSVWVGYAGSGVCRWKNGTMTRVGRENGLFDGNICALMPDQFGRMWFASDRGIFYAGFKDLDDFIDNHGGAVESIFFGRDAGLPSIQAYYGYWPGAMVDASGEILFPTHSGIAMVHPNRVQANPIPPNVIIQSLIVDGHPLAPHAQGRLPAIPPSHRRIEITFTAPSFVAPEQVRFRYRLDGWNDEWTETTRPRTAVFSRLPAGNYRFRVMACNNSDVWNETGDTLAFEVTPFFWQTWPFRIVAALIFTLTVAALVRHFSFRNVRLKLRQAEQEAALQKERARIAQDMHDDLGAKFTQISLLGELSRNALNEPKKARDLLGQISHVAQNGVKALDEIVWAVNPRNDTLPDLLDYTGQYARDFLAAADLWCRLDFPDDLPARNIPGDVRHAIFSILKEALNNVVKHARATRVKIIFILAETQMQWVIEDDGQGFAPAPDNALADGLRNISHRAEALHGRVNIDSRPGTGTRITLTIPLRN